MDNDTDVDGTIVDTPLAIVQPANGTVVDNGDGTPDVHGAGRELANTASDTFHVHGGVTE